MSDRYDPRVDPTKKHKKKKKRPRPSQQQRSRSRSPIDDNSNNNKEDDDFETERQRRMEALRRANQEEDEAQQAKLEPSKKPQDLSELTPEQQMQQLMGISSFGSTKNESVESNHQGAAKGATAKHKARKYRQYMNRKNGFNRPLDKMD